MCRTPSVGIISKSRIWNPVPWLFRSNPSQPPKLRRAGMVANSPTSAAPHAGVTSTLNSLLIWRSARGGSSQILSNRPRLVISFYDGYIYPHSPTDSHPLTLGGYGTKDRDYRSHRSNSSRLSSFIFDSLVTRV